MAKRPATKVTRRKPALDYAAAGVDVHAADDLVSYIRKRNPAIGGFAGTFPIKVGGQRVELVASTDGVGTKLKLAFLSGKHNTVGIDLVAMCVNDLVCCGATPLFFLDYLATGKLRPARDRAILDGIMKGCSLGGLALLGGETAEMPGFYADGEYDLAGFAVGLLHKSDTLDGKRVRPGDLLVGIPSSGVHANGFSLVRRAFDPAQLKRHARALLAPTRIYVQEAQRLRRALGSKLKALSHITGEGLEGNLPRVLPARAHAVVDRRTWEVPTIFKRIQDAGNVKESAMWSTFNMGVGMVAVVDASARARTFKACPDAFVMGAIKRGPRGLTFTE